MLKSLLGVYPDQEGKRVLDELSEASEIKAVRVVGRGTLSIDPQDVTKTAKYQDLIEKARKLVADT